MSDSRQSTFEELLEKGGLTRREAQVARLCAMGATARETGVTLGISPSTVASYRQRAYVKLGIAKASELRDLARGSRCSHGPLEEVLDSMTGIPNRPFGQTASFLLVSGGVLLVISLGGVVLAASHPAAADSPHPYAAIGVLLASVLLMVGELIYLRRYRAAREAQRALLGANEDFDRLARLFLSRHGFSELHAEALVLIAQGASSAEACRCLSIARGTLNSIRRKGYANLEVHSALQLARTLLLGAEEEWARGTRRDALAGAASPDPDDSGSAYDRETQRIIESAQGMGFAYAGVGLAVLAIIALSILATWLGIAR